jgi:hypothetical protein
MAFTPTYAGVGDNKIDDYGATAVAIWTITFSTGDTYVTGGLALVAATFGLSRPILGIVQVATNTAGIIASAVWNQQTSKLQLLVSGAELASATSLTGVVLTVLVITQR